MTTYSDHQQRLLDQGASFDRVREARRPAIDRDAMQEAELIELSRSQRMGASGGWGTRLGTSGAYLLDPEGKTVGYIADKGLAEDIARLLTNWNNAGGR